MSTGRSWWLLGGGVAAAAAVLAAAVWGRARTVEVSRPLRWPAGEVIVCGDGHTREAVRLWREHGHPVRHGGAGDRCDVVIDVDPTLDDRDSVEDGAYVHGRAQVLHEGGVIRAVAVRVVPGAELVVVVHEVGHSLGFAHPVAAPTGHVMHPSQPGLRDWRGLEGP